MSVVVGSGPLTRRDSRRLVEQAVDALRARIVAGVYGSDGELPPQGDLCRELGVSRSVIREAMQRLQSMRLISISQGRKPRVIPAGSKAMVNSLQLLMQRTDASLLQLAAVRKPLEAEIAALAAGRIDDEGRLRLRLSVKALERADDVEAQVEADVQFHRVLAEASGNAIFVFLLDALAELLRKSRRQTIGQGGIQPALAGHRAILAAVERGDSRAARTAMLEHLQAAQLDLQQLQHEKE